MTANKKPVVAIIGASFAGLSVLLEMRKRLWKNVTIQLFDMQEDFCYIPALHDAILAPPERLKKSMFSLKKYYPKEFIQGKITQLHKNSLQLECWKEYTFDYCVIATWSYVKFINHPDRSQYWLPVRYAQDIPKLNAKLTDPATKTITIVWWGYTWIEVASIIAQRKRSDQTVTIVHSRDRLLNTLSKKVSSYVQKRFDTHKIETVLNSKVKIIDKHSVTLRDWKTLASDVTIVSAWITLNDELIPDEFTFNQDYKAHQASHIFTCGDVAAHGLYTTAHNAMMEWRRVWDLIADDIKGIKGNYHELLNREILAIALWSKDWIILHWTKWYPIPWFTGFGKWMIEQRVLLEFKRRIMFRI